MRTLIESVKVIQKNSMKIAIILNLFLFVIKLMSMHTVLGDFDKGVSHLKKCKRSNMFWWDEPSGISLLDV